MVVVVVVVADNLLRWLPEGSGSSSEESASDSWFLAAGICLEPSHAWMAAKIHDQCPL